jgi:hypothetical protein
MTTALRSSTWSEVAPVQDIERKKRQKRVKGQSIHLFVRHCITDEIGPNRGVLAIGPKLPYRGQGKPIRGAAKRGIVY